jgi:hypothetical protein
MVAPDLEALSAKRKPRVGAPAYKLAKNRSKSW